MGGIASVLEITGCRFYMHFFGISKPKNLAGLHNASRSWLSPLNACSRPKVDYLTTDELAEILDKPNLSTIWGRRDAALLSLLYDTGARVQEVVDLSVRDVRLDPPAQICLTGKGRKTRVVPLMSATVNLLAQYMNEHRLDSTRMHRFTDVF